MSKKFEIKFKEFIKWYGDNNKTEKDLEREVSFLHASLDKTIELIECAQEDIRNYEGRGLLHV